MNIIKIKLIIYYNNKFLYNYLSADIDEAASKARYDDGVLTLTLAKKLKKSGQRIAID